MSNKLVARLAVLFAFVLAISVAVVYFTFDIRAVHYLTMFEPKCILLALCCLMVGLTFDGMRLITLANVTDERLPMKQVINVVLSNYFLALVTPGASGGAIAQVMFMKKAGVPVPKATVVVLVRTIMSIFFLILCVPVVLFTDPGIASWLPPAAIMTVSVIFTSLPVLAFFLMRTNKPKIWLYIATQKLSHTTRRNCFIWYNEFKQAFIIMGRHPLMVFKAFVESGLSLLFIYSTVPAFFTGLDFDFSLGQVMGRMILINLVLYFSPTPGGSGVAEAGFVVLFANILPSGTEGIMAVLWRFMAEYLPFMLGAVITIRAFGSNVMNMATIGTSSKSDVEG